jgi:putative N-acetylmannosamine-6-phosphate epimerase
MSLRQYTIEVLAAHCSLPTMEEWLSEVEALAPAGGEVSGADAVERARQDDDAEVGHASRGG